MCLLVLQNLYPDWQIIQCLPRWNILALSCFEIEIGILAAVAIVMQKKTASYCRLSPDNTNGQKLHAVSRFLNTQSLC